MSENTSTRRKFLQLLGLSTGATIISNNALASFISKNEILQLNKEQQAFMLKYGQWMDEFIVVIQKQKINMDDMENHQRMIALTEVSASLQPELDIHMKDQSFAIIYQQAIERMTKEIE